MSQNVKIYDFRIIIMVRFRARALPESAPAQLQAVMQIVTKLFRSQSRAAQLIMLARGILNIAGLHQIVVELSRLTQDIDECEMLIDLADASYELDGDKIDAYIDRAPLSRSHKIALISARSHEKFNTLSVLSDCLLSRGFRTAIFYDEKVALEWLEYRERVFT